MHQHFPRAGFNPVINGILSGWASPGAEVTLRNSAGEELARAVANRSLHHVLNCPVEPHSGFRMTLPEALLDGAWHMLRVTMGDGVDLPGSPLRFRATAARGVVDTVSSFMIGGQVEADPADNGKPITVVAMIGDEVIAIAIARPLEAGDQTRRFALILKDNARLVGQRIIHVGISGGRGFLRGSPAVMPPIEPDSILMRQQDEPVTLAIKISAPNLRVAHEWGDYHFARQLSAALQRRGWVVRVDCQDEWELRGDDVALVLRGRHRYRVDPKAINLMWQISHPDRVVAGEMNDYDHVFVASDIYARIVAPITTTPVSALHQATDQTVFRPSDDRLPIGNIPLFVGNSRKEFRTLVKWCVESNIDLAVFGSMWDGIIPDRYIRGRYISNTDLYRWYGSCGVLLNDHWDTMRDFGFLSNRLFDASAAGAFVITDAVKGLSEIFGDAIEVVSDAVELKEKISFYLAHPEARQERAARARSIVLASHTFDHRAAEISRVFQRLRSHRALLHK